MLWNQILNLKPRWKDMNHFKIWYLRLVSWVTIDLKWDITRSHQPILSLDIMLTSLENVGSNSCFYFLSFVINQIVLEYLFCMSQLNLTRCKFDKVGHLRLLKFFLCRIMTYSKCGHDPKYTICRSPFILFIINNYNN